MLEIISVHPSSPADLAGLQNHDQLVAINSSLINDKLDFTYFIQADSLELEILRDGRKIMLSINKNESFSESEWGLELADYQIKSCGNNCVFCFVHQNPKGLRSTLYIKDEDYRYSFLHGSYFTLTNISQAELDRIVTMRLSPLYISVHATNQLVRKQLLGLKREDNFLQKVEYLTKNGIELHTQIVLCPGINDGVVLKETVRELAARFPGVASVAVVPLGKTDHRKNLPELASVTPANALDVIKIIDELQIECLQKQETRFVFAADEFYLRAGLPVPESSYYENFDQYENGIGLVRSFLDELAGLKKKIPASLKKPKNVLLITGKAFAPVLKESLLPKLQPVRNLQTEVITTENILFGKEVTVAGLLCGRDILKAISAIKFTPDLIVLPPTCLNYDNLFLDDMSLAEFCSSSKAKVVSYTEMKKLFEVILE